MGKRSRGPAAKWVTLTASAQILTGRWQRLSKPEMRSAVSSDKHPEETFHVFRYYFRSVGCTCHQRSCINDNRCTSPKHGLPVQERSSGRPQEPARFSDIQCLEPTGKSVLWATLFAWTGDVGRKGYP